MSASTILTLAGGTEIDLLDPKPADIVWDSFAEHLAKEKRFNGATPDAEYSVAQHLSVGTDAVLHATSDKRLAAYFSLHDAPEGVLKDLTTPLKEAVAELAQERFGVLAPQIADTFKLLEYRHDQAIHGAAGLAWPMPIDIAQAVKRFDLVMFVTEWRDLMHDRPHPNWAPYSGIRPLAEPIVPWDWRTAKRALLRRWKMLLPVMQVVEAAS